MPAFAPSEWRKLYLPVLAVLFAGATCGLTVGRPIVQSNTWHFVYAEALQFPYPVASTQLQLLFTYILLLITKSFTHLSTNHVATSPSLQNDLFMPDTNDLPRTGLANQTSTPAHLRSKKLININIFLLAISITANLTLRAYSIFFAPLEIFLLSRPLVLPTSMLLMRLMGSKYAVGQGVFSQGIILSLGVLFAAYRDDLPRLWHIERIALLSAIFAAIWPFQFEHVVKLLTTPNLRDRILPVQLPGPDFWRLVRVVSKLASLVLLPILFLSGEIGKIYRNCYLLNVPDFWIDLLAGAAFQSIRYVSSLLFIKETSALSFVILAILVNISQVVVLTYSKMLSWQWIGFFVCILMAICFCCSSSIVPISFYDRIDDISRLFWKIKDQSRKRTLFKVHAAAAIIFACLFATMASTQAFHYRFNSTKAIEDWSPLSPTSDASIVVLRGNDSYLGRRPDTHTVANLDLLVHECRGTYKHLERMRDVQHCLNFLATRQDLYLSAQNYQATAIGNERLSVDQLSGPGTCPGPIILYHSWWTGLPSWRTELCIKSYFHTQNLGCSKLWIWVNVDQDPEGVLKWMVHDRFQHFMPLVDSGAIVIKEWRLPARVPLPKTCDTLDRARYYERPRGPNVEGEYLVADAIVRDASGQEYVQLYDPNAGVQLPYFTVAVSDAARLIILHLHGGVYLDMDVILLRDLRPLVLPGRGFAERWGSFAKAEMYNNALLSLPANSTLSSYLFYGGTRMGLMYHFRALGRMLKVEDRDDVSIGLGNKLQQKTRPGGMGLIKWETAFFDPMWAENDGLRLGKCTVPCIRAFEMVFQAAPQPHEWDTYEGFQISAFDSGSTGDASNRTMENFYRGAWAYHIHNQWKLQFEHGSWIHVITQAHDGFFNKERTNPYGEIWGGPALDRYI